MTPVTAPAHDPERLARCTRIVDELEEIFATFEQSDTADGIIRRLREWLDRGAPPEFQCENCGSQQARFSADADVDLCRKCTRALTAHDARQEARRD